MSNSQQEQSEKKPRSMNELLQWTIKYHESEIDRTEDRPLRQMDPERRKFLEEALKSLSVDEVEIMRKALVNLSKGDDEGSVEEKEQSMDDIFALIDNLDSARDLQIIGGFQVVIQYLKSSHPSLKMRAAEIAGTVVQNHFESQSVAIDCGTLPLLMGAFKDDNAMVRKKVISAISALIRNHQPATTSFLESGGLDLLRTGVNDPSQEVQVKAVFFLFKLLLDHEDIKKAIVMMGLIPNLIEKLDSTDFIFREHVLNVLNLLPQTPEALQVLKDPQHKLLEKLNALIQKQQSYSAEEKEAYREEIEGVNSLKIACFS